MGQDAPHDVLRNIREQPSVLRRAPVHRPSRLPPVPHGGETLRADQHFRIARGLGYPLGHNDTHGQDRPAEHLARQLQTVFLRPRTGLRLRRRLPHWKPLQCAVRLIHHPRTRHAPRPPRGALGREWSNRLVCRGARRGGWQHLRGTADHQRGRDPQLHARGAPERQRELLAAARGLRGACAGRVRHVGRVAAHHRGAAAQRRPDLYCVVRCARGRRHPHLHRRVRGRGGARLRNPSNDRRKLR
mmetsp:Transcript_31134/g.72883  ORF Transcript_31134/g.72883 Transcript_31134/m.72883 type:complete len:244 (+) Transcript_31134:138-869(+)